MAYVLSVVGSTVDAALAAAREEMKAMPPEAALSEAVAAASLAAADAVARTVVEPGEGRELRLSISGDDVDYGDGVSAASVSVSVLVAPVEEVADRRDFPG